MAEQILQMQNIEKSFTGVHALKDCHFDLFKGEVHALMGENGAGKSTLMKVLTGVHERDSGTIIYEGKQINFKKPKDAQDAGVIMVHQELNMMNHLTVAQNIFIGKETLKYGFWTDEKAINEASKKLFERLNIDIDPTEITGNLTVGKQQMVEIAKAISYNAKVLIFDEPTAALTSTEIKELFRIIADLKKQNVGIIYISHRMDEITLITDRVTVMRDGEYVSTLITKETSKDEIINMMIGRFVYENPKEKSNVPPNSPVVLKVENLSSADGTVKNLNFELKKGEILGFAGLMGAGRTEMARLIFGADQKISGDIHIKSKHIDIKTTKDAVENGIGYLSEDRKRYGLAVGLSISDNSVMASLENFATFGFVDEVKVKDISQKYVKSLNTKTPSVEQLVKNLSGGNQQKVVIAKWLIKNSEILIFDEPTRGIDVGAKSEIYKLMNDLVAQGKSVIMISSELTEILRMSDRIVVMCEGRKTGELDISEANQKKIMVLATMRE